MLFDIATRKVVQMSQDIGQNTYTAEEDVELYLEPRLISKTVFVLLHKPTGRDVFYASPPGSTPNKIRENCPSIQFPAGNGEIYVNLKKGESFAYAWISIDTTYVCSDGIRVITYPDFTVDLSANKPVSACIFHAPLEYPIYYLAETKLQAWSTLEVFDDTNFQISLETFTYRSFLPTSPISMKPLLHRLEVYSYSSDPEEQYYVRIMGTSKENATYADVLFDGEPEYVTAADAVNSIFKRSFTIPAISIILSVSLLASIVYSYIRVFRHSALPELPFNSPSTETDVKTPSSEVDTPQKDEVLPTQDSI